MKNKNKLLIILCVIGILLLGIGIFINTQEYIREIIIIIGMFFLWIGVYISSFRGFLNQFFNKYRTIVLIASIIVGATLLSLVFGLNINGVLGWFMTCTGIFALFIGLLSFKKVRAFIAAFIQAYLNA